MRMKRRDFAATLMAVLMAGSIFAGCGSADKNVNHNVETTQNIQNAKDEKETESTIQELEWNNGNTEDSNYEGKNTQESVENNNQNNNENNAPGESQAPASGGNVNIKDDNSLLASAKVNTVTYSAYASEVLRLVNIERDKVGAAHLVLDGALCDAANMRAIEMDYSGNFSHTRPDGRDCFTVFSFCKISFYTCGENIAAGYPTPAAVVDGWMNSTGHKANILNAAFTKMGLGYSTGGGGEYSHYWAQEFAG